MRYELLRRIGVGGMAEVFRARVHGEEGFEKEIVVKRILPHLSINKEFQATLDAEFLQIAVVGDWNSLDVFHHEETSAVIRHPGIKEDGVRSGSIVRGGNGFAKADPAVGPRRRDKIGYRGGVTVDNVQRRGDRIHAADFKGACIRHAIRAGGKPLVDGLRVGRRKVDRGTAHEEFVGLGRAAIVRKQAEQGRAGRVERAR